MTDERPEDDITEEALTGDAWSDGAVDDPEAPDADAQEQRQSVESVGDALPDFSDPEVPEADALEQARVVGGSEDEDYEPGPSEPPME